METEVRWRFLPSMLTYILLPCCRRLAMVTLPGTIWFPTFWEMLKASVSGRGKPLITRAVARASFVGANRVMWVFMVSLRRVKYTEFSI